MKSTISESRFEILNVEAAGCPGNFKYCPFKRGSEPRLRITFKPNRKVSALETTIQAKIGISYVPFYMENPNACKNSNLTCPLIKGQTYYYSQSVKIQDYVPKVNVQVNWMVNEKSKLGDEGQGGRDLCLIFLAKVVD
ncbi:unnamed protein product [Enterobius vermicularis]|uniref:ML domain-containing protein n=1 Tax=Enterobius vermicularis TaxID=51028 RepID=A0A0N4UUK5_ENTVE|nr:unnamed protein product [Enterobius vermicularis]